jgi:hypothetical protein
MNIKHRIDASIAELTMLRSSLSDKHDEQASEYKAMHRRIAEQRRELARLNATQILDRDLSRELAAYQRKTMLDAKSKAARITEDAATNIATAWREIALERMQPGETDQLLKIRAMHRAIELRNEGR